jgi:Carboxypeptidase regulatory-like domain
MPVTETILHRTAICGHVRDAASGAAIGGARVLLEQPRRETLTRPDGFYAFLDLAAGDYALQASAPALGSRYGSTGAATITVASAADGSPLLDPRGELKLPPTRLSGTVQLDNGTPWAHAQVLLPAVGARTLSDRNGRYELAAVQAGTQRVQVSGAGLADLDSTVALQAGQSLTTDFTMTPA